MTRGGTSAAGAARGAYGLRISGLPGSEQVLMPARPEWPELRIVVEHGHGGDRTGAMDERRARVVFQNGGSVVIERDTARATYTIPYRPTPEELVHPYLAPAAAAMAHWHGRETFHAGAFVAQSGAWAVLAEREGGKSTTLARLALDGAQIVCDDVLVLDEGIALAGPRAIDLRAPASRALGAGEPLGVVGTRERWRLVLREAPVTVPLLGWIFLTWASRLALEPVPAGERLRRLAAQRAVALPPADPGVLLRLAALPGFELRRPHRWSSLGPAVEVLLSSLS